MCKTGRIELKGLTLYTGGDELNMKTTDKLDKNQFAIARALAGLDGNGNELSKADLEKFNKMSKAEQKEFLDKALKDTGSNYRIAENVISNETLDSTGIGLNIDEGKGLYIIYSPNGNPVNDADAKNANFFGINYNEK